MRAGKHDRAPGNTNSDQQVGSVLKFLANFQKSGSDKAKEKIEISLFVNITIPGTQDSNFTIRSSRSVFLNRCAVKFSRCAAKS